ncbi:MAG: TRAP transporter substrate-binding protein [Proteobacteria bacterium]|nr:TRAP transporter substrate-binding protein [Pseudomonadota bacterium]MDA1059897.1 TRAP transporter substrate-binding protein [Pseudomonadota bacterium]
MLRRTFLRTAAAVTGAAAIATLVAVPALAQTKWDASVPWGPSEFHTKNLIRFAEEVKKVTNGEVEITVHSGGSLGIKGPESLRSVQDGIVPMAEMAGFQQTGDEPMLGFEALPYLINDYDELEAFVGKVRGLYEKAFEKHNQKMLYTVPWPSQAIFTKGPVSSMADLKDLRIRTYNKLSTELMTALGMSPQFLNSPDIVPVLAAGGLDAVMTSASTAVAQKYWEFLNHAYRTNHLWALNQLSVNLDAWNKLSAKNQKAIEDLARKLEPEFWAVSRGEDAIKLKELKDQGMTVEPMNPAIIEAMRAAGRPFWKEFTDQVSGTGPILDEFLKEAGKS